MAILEIKDSNGNFQAYSEEYSTLHNSATLENIVLQRTPFRIAFDIVPENGERIAYRIQDPSKKFLKRLNRARRLLSHQQSLMKPQAVSKILPSLPEGMRTAQNFYAERDPQDPYHRYVRTEQQGIAKFRYDDPIGKIISEQLASYKRVEFTFSYKNKDDARIQAGSRALSPMISRFPDNPFRSLRGKGKEVQETEMKNEKEIVDAYTAEFQRLNIYVFDHDRFRFGREAKPGKYDNPPFAKLGTNLACAWFYLDHFDAALSPMNRDLIGKSWEDWQKAYVELPRHDPKSPDPIARMPKGLGLWGASVCGFYVSEDDNGYSVTPVDDAMTKYRVLSSTDNLLDNIGGLQEKLGELYLKRPPVPNFLASTNGQKWMDISGNEGSITEDAMRIMSIEEEGTHLRIKQQRGRGRGKIEHYLMASRKMIGPDDLQKMQTIMRKKEATHLIITPSGLQTAPTAPLAKEERLREMFPFETTIGYVQDGKPSHITQEGLHLQICIRAPQPDEIEKGAYDFHTSAHDDRTSAADAQANARDTIKPLVHELVSAFEPLLTDERILPHLHAFPLDSSDLSPKKEWRENIHKYGRSNVNISPQDIADNRCRVFFAPASDPENEQELSVGESLRGNYICKTFDDHTSSFAMLIDGEQRKIRFSKKLSSAKKQDFKTMDASNRNTPLCVSKWETGASAVPDKQCREHTIEPKPPRNSDLQDGLYVRLKSSTSPPMLINYDGKICLESQHVEIHATTNDESIVEGCEVTVAGVPIGKISIVRNQYANVPDARLESGLIPQGSEFRLYRVENENGKPKSSWVAVYDYPPRELEESVITSPMERLRQASIASASESESEAKNPLAVDTGTPSSSAAAGRMSFQAHARRRSSAGHRPSLLHGIERGERVLSIHSTPEHSPMRLSPAMLSSSEASSPRKQSPAGSRSPARRGGASR